jgi:hypothetical protein
MKNMSDNIANVSTGFKSLSNHVETTLSTPKIDFTNISTIPIFFSIPSNAPNTSDPFSPSSSRHLFGKKPLPQLDRNEHLNISLWFPGDYNVKRKAGKKGVSHDLEEVGGEKAKSSILSCYMEDENGEEIPKTTRDAVRDTAKAFFELLLENDRAPSTWGNAPIDVKNEYLHIMETSFPFLRLCQDHWKAIKVATNSYSQWQSHAIVRAKGAKGMKKRTKREVIHVDTDEDDDSNEDDDTNEDSEDEDNSSKRPQDKGKDVPRPSKRPRIEENQPTPRPRPRPLPTPRTRPLVCNSIHVVCILH